MSSPIAELPGFHAEDAERRRRLLQQWRRHSALIGVLRKLLPALCVAILGTIAGWATVNVMFSRGEGVAVKTDAQIRMVKPNLEGRTDDGRPYLVQAESAVRDNADTAKVTLDKPLLTLGAGSPNWTTVRADQGVYREDNGLLDLRGSVTLDDDKGNHLVTQHAFIDTKKSDIEGETPIIGRGPLGAIQASSYSLRNGGAYVHFEGRVRSRIEHAGSLAPKTAPK